jgi:PAS domain S-box-containing protein
MLTAGQVDAVVDSDGQTYLLRPAQESLRQSERRLAAVIDSSPDVITVINRGGKILSENATVTRTLGYEIDELVGRSIFDCVHEDDRDRLFTAFFSVIEGLDEHATIRFRHAVRTGAFRLVEASIGKLHDASGECVILAFRPLPSPREERGIAPETPSSISADRFLAMLAHELRTPLAPVLMGIDALQDDERFAEAEPFLTMMRRNVALQSRLLDDLSDFTKIGQHKLRLHLAEVDAHEIVRFVQVICQTELETGGLNLRVNLSASETVVIADSLRLQQVVWNLLKNAIKFSSPGSTISISTTNDSEGCVLIEVADHGAGIEPAMLPLVFDCFQQGALSQQEGKEGLGLGLFIARGMAEAQGGTLTANSAGRGKGATFLLKLTTARFGNRGLSIETRAEGIDQDVLIVRG